MIVPESLLVVKLIIGFKYITNSRLGQIGVDRKIKLSIEDLPGSLTQADLDTCEPCLDGKKIRKPFEKINESRIFIEMISFRHLWSDKCESEAWSFIFHLFYRRIHLIQVYAPRFLNLMNN